MKKHTKVVVATVSILFVILAASLTWRSQNAPATPAASVAIDPLALRYANQANDYKLQGKYSQAVDEYRKSLQIQPDPDVQIQLGIALVRAGRREEAMQTLRAVAQNSDRAGDAAKAILDRIERDPQYGLPKR